MSDKVSFETYRELGPFQLDNLRCEAPSVGNGDVRVVRYRVTVERIEEPFEVIAERVRALYRAESNWHRQDALTGYARKHGIDLEAKR